VHYFKLIFGMEESIQEYTNIFLHNKLDTIVEPITTSSNDAGWFETWPLSQTSYGSDHQVSVILNTCTSDLDKLGYDSEALATLLFHTHIAIH
jgi:hypothetical protein